MASPTISNPSFLVNQFEQSGLLNLCQTAEQSAASPDMVMRLIKAGVIHSQANCNVCSVDDSSIRINETGGD
jgi:hypothetical protein